MPKMDRDEIAGTLDGLIRDAVQWQNTQLAQDRTDALSSYLGEPYFDDDKLPAGTSRVVTQDVLETIEWLMPSLLRIFASGEPVVCFNAVGPEDEPSAKQETEAVSHVWWQQNPGFITMHNVFKDALLQKLGVFIVEWQPASPRPLEKYSGLDETATQRLMTDTNIEVEKIAPNEIDPSLFDVEARPVGAGRVNIDAIPPEEFLISRNARSIDSAPFVAWRREMTISEIREMGYEVADDVGRDHVEATYDIERMQRFKDQGGIDTDVSLPKGASRLAWLTIGYPRLDADGDGIAERLRVVMVEREVIDYEEVDDHPFAGLSPIILPHRAIGLSVADLVADLQLIKTTLMRQLLNNLYATNHPRTAVQSDALVDIDEMLDFRAGGIVRTLAPPAQVMMPLTVPFMARDVVPVFELLEEMKSSRSGVTKYNQGLSADTLNPTATGVDKIMNAAMSRVEMIARIFAETGVRSAFLKVHKTLRMHAAEGRRIPMQLSGQWTEVDPRAWRERTDMVASVGLGTGDKTQQLQHLGMIATIQEKIIALQGGAQGPLVTLQNVYATASQMVTNAGLKTPERYFTDPIDPQTGQPRPQPPAPPDPTMAAAQAAMQIEQQKAATAHQKMMADVELARWKAEQEIALARWKAEQEFALKGARMEADAMMRSVRPGPEVPQ